MSLISFLEDSSTSGGRTDRNHDLRDVSTALHADPDVHAGETLLAQQQQRLQELRGTKKDTMGDCGGSFLKSD
ncbi:hypothetical protein CRUP_007429 [Coryphaenoides rupestris]|nr:hypothetical protein CRUP_007429 [Coryphaenoides rupestris]